MIEACFRSPLGQEDLKHLGRLALNFGYAEFLLDAIVAQLMKIDGPAKLALITPLATRRKLEIIEEHQAEVTDAAALAFIKSGCALVESANQHRNQLLHGYWAFRVKDSEHYSVAPEAHFSKKPSKARLSPDQLPGVADEVAKATQDLAKAWFILSGWKVEEIILPINLYAGEEKETPNWLSEYPGPPERD